MSEMTKLLQGLVLPAVGTMMGGALVAWLSRLTSLHREISELRAEMKHLSQLQAKALTEDRAELVLNKSLSSHVGDCQNIVLRPLDNRMRSLDHRVTKLEAA